MPVLFDLPLDLTDVLLQGEQLRSLAMRQPVVLGPVTLQVLAPNTTVTEGGGSGLMSVMGQDWELPGVPPEAIPLILRNVNIANNAGIATPLGSWIPREYSAIITLDVPTATTQWRVQGITRDAAGSPLANCRVVILETGRLAVTGAPVVAETISDGAGAYSVPVPLNLHYQAIAYKPGSPDVAGITRADVVPDVSP